jgi:adenosylhomocysteine nucleosidase
MRRILIVCPLPLELEALLSRIRESGYDISSRGVGPLRVMTILNLGWQVALAGHGKTQFGIQTQFLINHVPDLEAVICAGSAGGLSDAISVFDVVVAEKTVEHDYCLKFVSRPDPEFAGDQRLIAKVKGIQPMGYGIHYGAIASGDEDIVDAARASELRTQTNAMAVAWEGAGGARACRFNNLPFLEVRGITDTASNSAPVDFAENLKVAMTNVCDTLLAALT